MAQAKGGDPLGKYNTILFDLDGTLLDTLADLSDAVNHVLVSRGCPVRREAEIRSFIGNGIRKLMERALPTAWTPPDFEDALAAFRTYYMAHCTVKTRPYDGIPGLLGELKAGGFRLAVVSNKNDAAVKALTEHFFPGLIDASIGQREGVPGKPAPDMVEIALARLGAAREQAVYVGDSEVDSATAANGGLALILVTWGFGDQEALPRLAQGQLAKNVGALRALLLENQSLELP